MVVLIILLVNIQIIEKFSVEVAKENITNKFRRAFNKDDDTTSTFEIDTPSELFEYHWVTIVLF